MARARAAIFGEYIPTTPLEIALDAIGPRPRGKRNIKAWKKRRTAARREHGLHSHDNQ